MGVMSGMTHGSGTMGTATVGSNVHDSGMGKYSGMRSSDNYARGKVAHSMRPPPMRSDLNAYQSTGSRMQPYPGLMQV